MSKLSRNELIACLGGALLVLGLFLAWYQTAAGNPNVNIDGRTGEVTGWEARTTLRWLWLAAAVSPFVLAYVVLRGHQLSWARGEMTAVIAVAAFGLVMYTGLIDKPGEPRSEISLQLGYWLSFLGTILMFLGSALRSSESERRRKPPGVL